MADVYTVNTSYVFGHDKAQDTGKTVKKYTKGTEVHVYDIVTNDHGVKYGNVSKKKNCWIAMVNLKKSKSKTTSKKSKGTSSKKTGSAVGDMAASTTTTTTGTTATGTPKGKAGSFEGPAKENTGKVKKDTIYGMKESDYNKLMLRYIRAFGSPPRYTKYVDPYYSNASGIETGRAMATTWLSDPAIASLCPGSVDYLPGFSSKKKDQFWNKVSGLMSGDLKKAATADHEGNLNGKLYAFKSAYKDYINVVNLLARTAADLMGIGDVTDIISGSSVPLKNFDYGWYTTPSKVKKSSSIFEQAKKSLNATISGESYVHFFLNKSGSSVSESFSTSSGASWLENLLGSDNNLSQAAQNLQFLFGGALTSEANADIDAILQDATGGNDLVNGFTTIATNYIKGGRLVFPQMITGMRYDKTITLEFNFSSIYGDKRSIFKYVTLPALHLLAMGTPIQISDNMYTYPFLVRAYQQGSFNTDLGFISSLEFSRGGDGDSCWTVDGLTTEMVARVSITPLYSNMMVTSARNPFLFLNNTALMEYLGTMCGLDLRVSNFNTKVEVAKHLLRNAVMDTPTTLARGITDVKLIQELHDFMSFL